jgi:hypothetical protein
MRCVWREEKCIIGFGGKPEGKLLARLTVD